MDRIFNYILGALLILTLAYASFSDAKYKSLHDDFDSINISFKSLNTSFNQVLAQAEAQKMDIQEIQIQDRQDYEALEKSCKAQIKQAVEKTIAASKKPVCKTGVVLYDLGGK